MTYAKAALSPLRQNRELLGCFRLPLLLLLHGTTHLDTLPFSVTL